jgi:hypothetical protein
MLPWLFALGLSIDAKYEIPNLSALSYVWLAARESAKAKEWVGCEAKITRNDVSEKAHLSSLPLQCDALAQGFRPAFRLGAVYHSQLPL